MVKLKKYTPGLKQFVLFLTFLSVLGCGPKSYQVTKIEGKEIGINEQSGNDASIENYIKPYRDNIDKDLSTVLAYAPETIDKTGMFQCPIGNLMADVAFDFGNRTFKKQQNKNLDMCLLNFGGIRSIIPKGNVTTKTAFEIMPFENSLVVAELKAEQIREMVNYIFTERKAHPISGLTFTIMSSSFVQDIEINGKPLDDSKVYYVITSDYLINGGDKMDFFKKSLKNYDLNYKLRNVLIDYFKEVDTIPMIKDVRIRASY